jgi:non-homologous end joining protein Ku
MLNQNIVSEATSSIRSPGNFEPDKFEDHYETALIELINSKRSGKAVAGFAGLIAVVVWKRLI